MKYSRLVFHAIVLIILFAACRKEWSPTQQDMAEYGWTLYEQKNFPGSLDWFKNSVKEDKDYQDGYNGMGWSYGQNGFLDSAIWAFDIGLQKPRDLRLDANVFYEILAGLTFAYSGLLNDSGYVIGDTNVIYYGDSLITMIDRTIGQSSWSFSHDSTTNYLDVHITASLSHFVLAEFDKSLKHVLAIESATEYTSIYAVSDPFVVDIATVLGRTQLADRIDILQERLKGI